MWQAWQGNRYRERRIMLLGESCYDWREDGTLVRPLPNHPINIVRDAIEGPPGSSRFMTCLTRAVCGVEWPTTAQSSAAWHSVAFTNYVPVSVGEGAGVRPTPAAWQQAKDEWFQLLHSLRPKSVIVFGIDMWSKMPRTQHYTTDRIQGYDLADGSIATCYALVHPSSPRGSLGWRRYADFIREVAGAF